ncbi:MAG: DUF2760 domain-containing protein [Proteobacteria bacterium]|nr:DUF2760 domain-containing protein [Pseudomonadota bacterium]
MTRLGLALRCFFRVLSGKSLPREVLAAQPGARALPRPELAAAQHARVVQWLGVLQKEGRLIDFLQEEIAGYSDDQVGAAVRSIHAGCRRALAEHLQLAPVLEGSEDSAVTIEPGFDPSRIRLVGNVTGDPPFTGLLRHHGWRAATVTLPDPAAASDPMIIAPAEVELA